MKAETGFIAILGIWVVYAILCIGLSIGAIYAIIHFITKFW